MVIIQYSMANAQNGNFHYNFDLLFHLILK